MCDHHTTSSEFPSKTSSAVLLSSTTDTLFDRPITIDEVQRALVELGCDKLGLSVEDLVEYVDDQSGIAFANRASEEQRFTAIVTFLTQHLGHLGHYDGPGDCPVCERNGWIALDKHKSCVEKLFEQSEGKCDCGAEATTIYNYSPICRACEEHERHLDALAE